MKETEFKLDNSPNMMAFVAIQINRHEYIFILTGLLGYCMRYRSE